VASLAVAFFFAGFAVETSARTLRWSAAGALAEQVTETLRREGGVLPRGATVDCSALPDNLDGAYVYRSGCSFHVALLLPQRNLNVIRERFSNEGTTPVRSGPVFAFTADGRRLVLAGGQ
jgi:hypothetical protein